MLPEIDELLAARFAEDEQAEAHEAVAAARGPLKGLLDRVAELDTETLKAAVADAELTFGEYSIEAHGLRHRIRAMAEQDAGGDTAQQDAESTPLVA